MAHRRSAVLAALAAAFFTTAAAFAAPALNPQVLQCDGTYAAGSTTHAPYTMPISVDVIVQDASGLRVGPAATRMGLVTSHTLGLWRFDSNVANVNIAASCAASGACADGFCWTYNYTYADENGSSPMNIGTCTYGATSCVNGSTVSVVTNTQLPLVGSCPNPGTLSSTPAPITLFQADGHFTDAGNSVGVFGGTQFGSVPFNSPTGPWNLPATYTLSAWIKTSAGGSQRIVSEQGPAGYWGMGINGGGLRSFDSRDVPAGTGDITLGGGYNDGAWHQIHIVRANGLQRRYYVDGKLIGTPQTATSTTSFSANPISHPVMFGRYEAGGENFTGLIDEVRIVDTNLSDDDILLEYVGTAHRYSSDGGVTFSTAVGSYVPGAANATTALQHYRPGPAPTPSSVWVFEAQNTRTATSITSNYSVTVDNSKPAAPNPTGVPTTINDINWSWGAPPNVCVAPGTPAPGPYYQLADCASGAVVTPPSTVFEPARVIGENYPGAPNRLQCRQLLLTDVWGVSPLSLSATAYTLAATPSAVSFVPASISTGGFIVTWNANGNPAYTRYEITYALDAAFTVGVATRASLAANYNATSAELTGLLSGTTYYLRVRAFNGRSSDFFGTAATPFATANVVTDPPAPAHSGAGQSTSSVLWSWSIASGATGYTLLDSSNQAVLYAGPFTSKLVSGLAVNTRYDTEVQADMPTPTPPSARGRAFAYTWANPPVGLTAAAVNKSSVTFVWGANGNPGYTFYEVAVASDATFGVVVATLSVAGTTVTATNLFPGVTYFARVRAFNGLQLPTAMAPAITVATAADPLTTVTPAPASPYVASAGLAGAWQFDEGSGLATADGSGNSNTGNFVCLTGGCASTPTFAAGPPGLGSAASFSGLAGAAVLTGVAPFNALGSLTVEAWVNPQTGFQVGGAGIVSVGRQNQIDFALDVSPLLAYRFQTSNGAAEIPVTSTTPIIAGQWTHVVGVFDQALGSSTLYLNGRAVGSVTGVPAHPHSGQVLAIGNRQDTGGAYALPFFGRIDTVRVIGRALTAAEVLADYTGGFVSSVTPPSPNAGVIVALPPNAFGAPAQIYITADPVNHPIRVPLAALNAGLASPPAGLTLVPNSLIEVVPVVGGTAFTGPLGSSATLSLPYSDANGTNLIDGTNPPLAASALQMYTLNTTVNRWELLPTTVDKINKRASGVTPHFSVFALFAPTTVSSGLGGVKIYPVPWKPGSGGRFDGPGVSFANLPASGRIRILTLSGRRVRDFTFSGAGAGTAVWDGANDDGRRAASGVYFAKITSDADNSTVLLKFAIER